MGRLGSLRPARERRMALATTRQRRVLADHALAQALFHLDELLHFAFEHARDGNAGPLADDLGDVFLVDLFFQHARRAAPLPSCDGVQLLQLGFELGQFAVLDLRGALELALARLLFDLEAQRLDLLLQLADAGDGLALLGPARAQSGDLLLSASASFALDLSQALLAVRVGLALQRRALDFERGRLRAPADRSPSAPSRSEWPAKPRPRRPGRWPCRAESGR